MDVASVGFCYIVLFLMVIVFILRSEMMLLLLIYIKMRG